MIDVRGRACPVPVIELAKAVEAAEVGDLVDIVSDDPASKVDIPVWCRMKHQELMAVDETEQGWSFTVRRVR